jgi:hypothetical protein
LSGGPGGVSDDASAGGGGGGVYVGGMASSLQAIAVTNATDAEA